MKGFPISQSSIQPIKKMNIRENIKTWISTLALFPFIVLLVFNGGKFIPLLDHFNLLIHEGGHGIFKIFGDFVYTLGGTLMQIILPSLFIFFYLKNRKKNRLADFINMAWTKLIKHKRLCRRCL